MLSLHVILSSFLFRGDLKKPWIGYMSGGGNIGAMPMGLAQGKRLVQISSS